MNLTCILDIYFKFKGRKGCTLNHFRFWKIKKMVKWGNKQVKTHGPWGKARQEYHELEDEKLPLWSKKMGKKTWEMRHEARFNYMEI